MVTVRWPASAAVIAFSMAAGHAYAEPQWSYDLRGSPTDSVTKGNDIVLSNVPGNMDIYAEGILGGLAAPYKVFVDFSARPFRYDSPYFLLNFTTDKLGLPFGPGGSRIRKLQRH
jgi:hypothetical protein